MWCKVVLLTSNVVHQILWYFRVNSCITWKKLDKLRRWPHRHPQKPLTFELPLDIQCKMRVLKQNQFRSTDLVTWNHWSGFLLLESSISTGINWIKCLRLSVDLQWQNQIKFRVSFNVQNNLIYKFYIWFCMFWS